MATREDGVFAISVAARMASMEIQNLRVYERRGLVEPDRTPGGTRLVHVSCYRRATGARRNPAILHS